MNRRFGIATIVLVAVGLALAVYGRMALREPLQIPGAGYTLDVAAGTTLPALVARLGDDGVLEHAWALSVYARATGMASAIKAGEYEVVPGTTSRGLLHQLVEGRVRLHSLTIIEGWTTHELFRAVRKHPAIRQTLPSKDPGAVVRALEIVPAHPEGWFFPDTYRFPRGTSDVEVLTMAHERMKTVLEQAWAARTQDLPLRSAYEALTLASIVEKETGLDRERPRIAGVFVRRLKTGMRLQTDPTVIYGLGEQFEGDITRRHLQRDTPYNTYTRSGLPPSPISLPGESSLLAAVHPDDSDALFFVASGNDDGSHVFSATLRDHNAAVRKYLAASREDGR